MGHVLHVTDDVFRVMTALAAERKQTPEELLRALLDAAWEEACAKYDAAFERDPEWLAGAREALAEADAGRVTSYPSTEAFLRHLGVGEEQLEDARRADRGTAGSPDADAR